MVEVLYFHNIVFSRVYANDGVKFFYPFIIFVFLKFSIHIYIYLPYSRCMILRLRCIEIQNLCSTKTVKLNKLDSKYIMRRGEMR